MKDRPEIIFVFRKSDGTIERRSEEIPISTYQYGFEVPKDALLHEIMLRRAEKYSRVQIAGKMSSNGPKERVVMKETFWLQTQLIKLETPLYDDISITFDVDASNQLGLHQLGLRITNLPTFKQKPKKGRAKRETQTVSRVQRLLGVAEYKSYKKLVIYLYRQN